MTEQVRVCADDNCDEFLEDEDDTLCSFHVYMLGGHDMTEDA